MKSVIFKMQTGFNSSPNKMVPISNEYILKGGDHTFGGLSKTNIFIGENNSGKSRFLRYLFCNDFYAISNENIDRLFQALRRNLVNPKVYVSKTAHQVFNLLYEEGKNEYAPYSNRGNSFFSNLENLSISIKQQNKFYFPPIRGLKDYKTILDGKLKDFLKSASSIQNKDAINHYISLLNLEDNGLDAFDVYREIIRHEYFSSSSTPSLLNIITGGDLYRRIKSMLLGEEKDRKLVSDFQTFLKNNFFMDYESVQLIPNESKKVLFVKIGTDERAIYDWGDGTQQLIIMLFSLFIHKDETDNLFFIEEPEIYLHPGILRKFIEVINSDAFPHHQYFITTHSNAILDTSADTDINMSIYKFKKVRDVLPSHPQFEIEQCNSGDVSLLNELGVRNSSVFLANCSIWVEGITDRLYLRHYLGLYFKKHETITPFRENVDYTFIEYGGNNIVHFNFESQDSQESINAKYINNRIFLIADNDNTHRGTAKAERKEHFKEVLGDCFYELPVTEIENLISQQVIEQILKKQNPKSITVIEQKFAVERKYKNQKLGRYLDKLFKNTNLKKYSAGSGTIKDKLAFCKAAIAFITDYDMLTDEAKDMVQRIVDFIKANN